ncbi:MAG: putative toxin-antitoxin system toxin component, PIN family [Lachnospiraceae bacterium]|nr:putative toxin-antitoxin system toxin component, PIN family [Lachnospiraceae bacterium]
MKYYAVIDTNVIVSGLISKNSDSAAVKVLREVLGGRITPLYHDEIIAEYDEVLHREKFHLQDLTIQVVLSAIREYGLKVLPAPTGEILTDMDDLIFYEVAMEKRSDNSWLVTGNLKHYPARSFIVTPAEMMDILDGKNLS